MLVVPRPQHGSSHQELVGRKLQESTTRSHAEGRGQMLEGFRGRRADAHFGPRAQGKAAVHL